MNIYENIEEVSALDESALDNSTIIAPVDEEWLLQQAEYIAFTTNSTCVYRIMSEIRHESKLQQIFESPRFDRRVVKVIIERSFDDMIKRFKQDCFQHNPHMNYLKIPLVLRLAIDTLIKHIELVSSRVTNNDVDVDDAAVALTTMLKCIEQTEYECLVYVEAQFVEKFIGKHLLRHTDFDVFVRFVCVCLTRIKKISENQSNDLNRTNDVLCICKCIDAVLRQRHIVAEVNNNLMKFGALRNVLVPTVYRVLKEYLASETFSQTYALDHLIEQQRHRQHCEDRETELKYAMAIFIGKFVECCYGVDDGSNSTMLTSNVHHVVKFKVRRRPYSTIISQSKLMNNIFHFQDLLVSLAISALRIDVFYFFAVTPYEVLRNFDWDLSNHRRTNRMPSIPIDYLNDGDIVEKFVRR